ncbi:MAG: type VII secretion protein EssC, partial [bacterium]|nr:type VII secretion protein EssC [bacterium]
EKTNKEKDKCNYTAFAPYYVLIIDDFEFVRNIGIIDNILNCDINIGYSLVILTEELNVLPNECQSFLTLDQTTATLFNSKHIMKNITVITPQYPSFLLTPCYTAIANIPIDISNSNFTLPQSYSFLEMYDVGNVQQLNSLNRWKESNPTSTLGAPVGVGENGELLRLDLHEKSHGPHGLIAGMTGSGKSEFIITYILSMAVNYSPHEINFVLIDYKGGGLAGAFENKEMGYKLPHLVGTITNLDTVELNRSLVSIESELKRRQAVFNKVRDQLQEATIDIYKYQRFYREKKVEEPLPHLFIICDEFAELKVQQPEFMDQLVSTARIGRSLGVHLILATQKPSGVVSDQIWSNSRFKVCLKVQEKADSTDMIKRPDAAMLNTVGRFYLQVGYNEYFALGQSAWCGANYYETDKRKKKMDTNLTFVDNIGNIIKSEDIKDTSDISRSKGEELPNILSYIIDISNQGNYNVKQLWLTRIPNIIFVNNLIKKYNYNKENFNISPVIGEYDAPKEQKQGLLTLPLTTNGNTIIYGLVGSGKENLLTTIIYSLITTYVTEEINIYIVDFGAEQLTMFKNAPQVGDVITVNDTEKVTNLFKLIENLTKERKKLFQDYNGDWSLYCKNSGTTTPATIIIINNIEVFNEIYESYIDLLIILTRDCSRYGIIFIITATAVSSIRIKLNQNFPQILPLQLKDKYEYSNILGKTDNLVPSQVQGRGLVKLAAVYEFQSAYPCQVENMSDTIKNVCHQLQETLTTKAKPIAILPEVVNVSYVQDKLKGLTQVPVGIEKENLEITSFNFNNCGTIISATDINDCTNFVQSLAFEFTLLSNATVFILDAEKLILNPYPNYNYSFNDFDNVINILDDYITKMEDVKQESSSIETLNQYPNVICLIIGIEKFKTVITTETLTKFEQLTSRIKLIDKINFVFVDDNANIKKISYDNWYKNIINNISGIWIGPNVSDQTAIKINNVYKLNNNIDKKYGYLVSNGQTKLIKLIASYKEGNNE